MLSKEILEIIVQVETEIMDFAQCCMLSWLASKSSRQLWEVSQSSLQRRCLATLSFFQSYVHMHLSIIFIKCALKSSSALAFFLSGDIIVIFTDSNWNVTNSRLKFQTRNKKLSSLNKGSLCPKLFSNKTGSIKSSWKHKSEQKAYCSLWNSFMSYLQFTFYCYF